MLHYCIHVINIGSTWYLCEGWAKIQGNDRSLDTSSSVCIPTVTTEEEVAIVGQEHPEKVVKDLFSPICLGITQQHSYNNCIDVKLLEGGDQMMASRIWGSQCIRSNAEREKEKLLGLSPMVEDWHALMTVIAVSSISTVGPKWSQIYR